MIKMSKPATIAIVIRRRAATVAILGYVTAAIIGSLYGVYHGIIKSNEALLISASILLFFSGYFKYVFPGRVPMGLTSGAAVLASIVAMFTISAITDHRITTWSEFIGLALWLLGIAVVWYYIAMIHYGSGHERITAVATNLTDGIDSDVIPIFEFRDDDELELEDDERDS